MNHEILIFEAEGNQIEVKLDGEYETLWLSQKLMAELFDRDVRTVNEHLKNIYKEQELTEGSTIRKFRIVRTEGKRDVEREIDHYNLDAIISVGYRVNSKKGTQFRQWATARLKEHLVQGYTLNEVRLQQHKGQLHQLEQTLSLFQQNVIDQTSLPEAQGLVKIIADYTNTFVLLNQFDSERLPTADFDEDIRYQINNDEARDAIALLVKRLIAKGEDHAGSDVDVMLVGEELSYSEIMQMLAPIEAQLQRPVNPTLYSPSEFAGMLRAAKIKLNDTQIQGLSEDSQFSLAYGAAHA